MSIVKKRYFAGFMKSQEKWLNSMSDKGFRLVKTGILNYTFEECTPGAYRYAIDYVGDKSKKDSEDYKAFLESLGYRVFYKNINLDFSTFRLTVRPWAEWGGIVSTNPGTYNKELMIVEKENDGAEFSLHTEKEDLIDYYKRMSYPWYFIVFVMLVLAILFWPFIFATVLMVILAVIFTIPIVKAERTIKELKKDSYT
ncbi:MAG: DUF2812 domain-containing protein [Lachnospiraceae bacterium]|nr:DUF2812 domain-containing protein [Lachnospiraceae bacterium]